MDARDMRVAHFRSRMLDELRVQGIRSPNVLAALGFVRRERFVDELWVAGDLSDNRAGLSPIRIGTGDGLSERWISLIFDVEKSLVIQVSADTGKPQSSLSAPIIVAKMLVLLELEEGMNVLEIGTGSGYNAALLASLVGESSLVTTIDIDEQLVSEAERRLRAAECEGVHLVCGDGDLGFAAGGPYSRIVVTAGCADVSPAWVQQLRVGGMALVPVAYGMEHPLVRVVRNGADTKGQVVGRAAFLAMRGRQAGFTQWVQSSDPVTDRGGEERLDSVLKEAVRADGSDASYGGRAMWSLGFYLALRDRRASVAGTLQDARGSVAEICPGDGTVRWGGQKGTVLRDRLLQLTGDWVSVGEPSPEDYLSRWIILGEEGNARETAGHQEPREGPWYIRRVHHREVIELRGLRG